MRLGCALSIGCALISGCSLVIGWALRLAHKDGLAIPGYLEALVQHEALGDDDVPAGGALRSYQNCWTFRGK